MKPVLYLDLDDTCLAYPGGQAGPGVPEFIRWAKEHFEVRWLTMWCPSGDMAKPTDGTNAALLSLRLKITEAEILEIVNPHPFPVWGSYIGLNGSYRDKSESIRAMLNETPDREWVWVEAPHLERSEWAFIVSDENSRNYYRTSVSEDGAAVVMTAGLLAERFKLPHCFGLHTVEALFGIEEGGR